jgi:hypothetical protein
MDVIDPNEDHDYHGEKDIQKIISMLEEMVIKPDYDANIGVGPGDYAFGDIRIPAKQVKGFVNFLRNRSFEIPEAWRGDPIGIAYYRGKADARKEERDKIFPVLANIMTAYKRILKELNNRESREIFLEGQEYSDAMKLMELINTGAQK